jgi:hypothetical protein
VSYVAEYRDKSFSAGRSSDSFYGCLTGGSQHEYRICELYLKLSDGAVLRLSELSEDTVRKWLPKENQDWHISEFTSDGKPVTRYAVEGQYGNRFTFHDGNPVGCVITYTTRESPLRNLQIGPKREGEFVSFPLSRKDLTRVFGKPDRIRRLVNPKAF